MRILSRSLALAAALALPASTAFAWTPPADPNSRVIHAEARQDRIHKRFDDALAKHLWLHNEATDPAFRGVRLSFALADWATLAIKYEPAMAALRKTRETALADVKEGRSAGQAFADYAAINRELDEESGTRELFVWVEANDPMSARAMYSNARDALIEAKDFARCSRYLDPVADLAQLSEIYRAIDATMKYRVVQTQEKEAFERFFITQTATLVALLAANNRVIEAARIVAAARTMLDTPEMRTALEQALEGRFPPRVPSKAETRALREAMP
jgi:hypothetical protein